MPQDSTPIDHGLAHPQPERGTIPQPKPKADDDPRELVPAQPVSEYEHENMDKDKDNERGAGGHTDFVQQPD